MILSRNRYLSTQSTPNPAMLAAITDSVRNVEWGSPTLLTTATAPVESPQPATVNAQNGMTSRRMWARPRLPHTQYLFRANAGMDVIMVEVRLALVSVYFRPR